MRRHEEEHFGTTRCQCLATQKCSSDVVNLHHKHVNACCGHCPFCAMQFAVEQSFIVFSWSGFWNTWSHHFFVCICRALLCLKVQIQLRRCQRPERPPGFGRPRRFDAKRHIGFLMSYSTMPNLWNQLLHPFILCLLETFFGEGQKEKLCVTVVFLRFSAMLLKIS